jgi:hypothetical protein
MWAFRYLFYRLYRWQARCWRNEDVSFNAFLLMVIFLFLNLGTLVGIAESVLGRSFVLARVSHTGVLVLGALIALPLNFLLLYNQRYKHIVREFESETPHQRRVRGIGVLLYIVFSLVFVFAGAMLHGKMLSH